MALAALITWNYALNDETGFMLQRSTNSGSTWSVSFPQPVTTSYVDATVVTGSSYWYRIAVTNRYGTGSFSNTGSVFIPLEGPNPPSNLMLSSGSVIATWQSGAVDANHSPRDYYTFQKSYGGINFTELRVTLIETTTDVNVTASAGTGSMYWYKVAAVNVAGTSSFTPTASIGFIYDPPLGSITLNATSQSGYLKVDITSSIVNSTNYFFYRSVNTGSFSLVFSGPFTGFDDSNVTTSIAGNTYTYYANTVNFYGTSSNSNTASVLLQGGGGPPMGVPIITTASFVPFTPVNLTVTSGSAILNWHSASNNQSYYSVWKSLDGNLFNQLSTVTGSISTFTDMDVTSSVMGITYWYAVAAVNSAGTSSASNTASITFAEAPLAPILLPVMSGSAILTWISQSNQIDFFVVQRSLDTASYSELTTIVPVSNLLVNGGFETGDYTGWTLVDPSNDSFISADPQYKHSGNWGAEFGPYGGAISPPGYGTLSQTVSTTPGGYYTMSFWLNAAGGGTLFQVWWDGAMVADLSPGPGAFTQYTYYVTASGTTATLQFRGDNEPAWYGIDDVVVGGGTPVLAETYTDSDVSQSIAGNTYYYRVAAVNSHGTSSFSNTGSITFTQTLASCWTLNNTILTP